MTTFSDQHFAKPIGILGGGVSGKAVKKFINTLGGDAIIYDETPGRGDSVLFEMQDAAKHDLIINSPGFPPYHAWFSIAHHARCAVIGEIEFASQFWNGPIFFVTGTNGKSTITQLLTAVLIEAGYDAFSFGNIGIPFSEHYKFNPRENAIAVVEISSFQAWNLQSTEVDGIIWTNFAEDHLDWHKNLLNYFEAKWNALCRVTGGPIVMGQDVLDFARALKTELPAIAEVVDAATFEVDPQQSISLINQLNVEYVKRFVGLLGLDPGIVDHVTKRFAFLPHRLEYVGDSAGVRFWNDSKATNFHAVEAALESFYAPVIWLGGGVDKGGDIEAFAFRIAQKIRLAITFGSIGGRLADALLNAGVLTFEVDTMQEAMDVIKMESHPGDEVVLSPAFASFDQFTGYADRGRQFKNLVIEKFFNQTQYPIQLKN